MTTDIHDEVLEEVLADSHLDPELVETLLRLAYEYHKNLDAYGKKVEFERAVQDTIELSMAGEEER